MNILLTNDDGVGSPSLLALAERLRREHEVWIVAPDKERSGSSHAISIRTQLLIKTAGPNAYACSGTPADCVLVALLGLVKTKIDMVISGPNLGANLGTDIIYSGTVAAARQAAFMRVPAIAASLVLTEPLKASEKLNGSLGYAVEFIANNLSLFSQLAENDHFLNINFPPLLATQGHIPKTLITFPSVRIYKDVMQIEQTQDGDLICEITGELPVSHFAAGSDYEAVQAGAISISPLALHPPHQHDLTRYQHVSFRTSVN